MESAVGTAAAAGFAEVHWNKAYIVERPLLAAAAAVAIAVAVAADTLAVEVRRAELVPRLALRTAFPSALADAIDGRTISSLLCNLSVYIYVRLICYAYVR